MLTIDTINERIPVNVRQTAVMLDRIGHRCNSQFHSKFFQFIPSGLVNFHPCLSLSLFIRSPLLAGQKDFFKSGGRFARFYESNQFIHPIQKFIEGVEFFDGDGFEKHSIDAM